jgi:triphosphatase
MSLPPSPPRSREIELKLDLDPADLAACLAHPALARSWKKRRLTATYFDTPDDALRAKGLSLRVRREGRKWVQTLKAGRAATGGLFDREEWEAEVPTGSLDLSVLAETPLGACLAGRETELTARFVVVVLRRSARLTHDGATLDCAVDEGEIRAGERRAPICEIELELVSGSAAALFGLARTLADLPSSKIAGRSKSERGYLFAADAPLGAVKQRPADLAPDATTRDAFRAIARDCLAHLQANAPALTVARLPEAVHQTRVALRRLRAALSLFADVVGDEARDGLRADLSWYAGALGEARDLDVFLESGLADAATADKARERRALAYEHAIAAASSDRARRLVLDVLAWIETGAWADGAELDRPAADFACDLLERRRGKLRKRSRRLTHRSPEERHRIRIAVKKLRYAAEFFGGLFTGKKARRRRKAFIAACAEFQERLGDLNDRAVAAALIGDLGGAEPEPEAADDEEALAAAKRAGRAFRKAEPFWR